MGYSTANTVFILILLMGMVKEDETTAAGLAGNAPDWKGVEDLLKNISSGSRHPGDTNVKYCGENVFKSTLKPFMQSFRENMHYLWKTCTMLI